MAYISFLNRKKYKANDDIIIHIPTVKEIRGEFEDELEENEKKYFNFLQIFTSTPSSMMVALDDVGIDFTTISEYELFLILFKAMKNDVDDNINKLFFENIDIKNFEVFFDKKSNKYILFDEKNNIKIDERTYIRLSYLFCQINFIEKVNRKMGNETMRDYAIERERIKMKRVAMLPYMSPFDKYLVALVNNCNFKYNYDEALELTIYDLNISLRQIIKKYQVDNLNRGIYAGTISQKDISKNDLDWFDVEMRQPRVQATEVNTKETLSKKSKSED